MAVEKEIICSPEAFWRDGPPCVIFGASPNDSGSAFAPFAKRPRFLIAADGGREKALFAGLTPDLLIGDRDSGAAQAFSGEEIRLPAEKDDTDLHAAAKEGLKRGYRRFILVGCAGGRLDHFLSALAMLSFLEEQGAAGLLLTAGNEIYWARAPFRAVLSKNPALPYFSLQAADRQVEGVLITGAKYPMSGQPLPRGSSLGISNEVWAEQAVITAAKGEALIIRSGQ